MRDAQVTEGTDLTDLTVHDEPDALFGVFQSIGEDLGIDPFYLRVAFFVGLFFSPIAMIAAYAALGVAVALSRWLFPKPRLVPELPVEQPEVKAVEVAEARELIAA